MNLDNRVPFLERTGAILPRKRPFVTNVKLSAKWMNLNCNATRIPPALPAMISTAIRILSLDRLQAANRFALPLACSRLSDLRAPACRLIRAPGIVAGFRTSFSAHLRATTAGADPSPWEVASHAARVSITAGSIGPKAGYRTTTTSPRCSRSNSSSSPGPANTPGRHLRDRRADKPGITQATGSRGRLG